MSSPVSATPVSPRRLIGSAATGALAAAAVLAGLGTTLVGFAPVAATAATEAVVVIDSAGVSPRELSIEPGDTVTWWNQDGERHRMRARIGPSEFDTGNIEPGERASVTLHATGTYSYVDERDRDDSRFAGTITVAESSGGPSGGDGGGSSGGGGSSAPSTAAVSIVDRAFSPAGVTVAVGGTVRWTNTDDDTHTATADGGTFDSGVMSPGGTFEHTFSAPGTFSYFCVIHPDMVGSVEVVGDGPAGGGDAGSPPPPSSSSPSSPGSPTGGGAPVPGGSPGPGAQTHTVSVEDFAFSPPERTIAAGDSVLWRNVGAAAHTVTGDSFDSGLLRSGGEFRVTFPGAGTFSYLCSFHPEMVGTVVVTGDGQGGAPRASGGSSGTAAGGAGPDDVGARSATGSRASAGGDRSSASAPTSVAIEVRDFAFSPSEATVQQGGDVVWKLTGAAPHTITASAGQPDSGILQPGDEYRFRFVETGTVSYACVLHPEMVGTVEVVAAPVDAGNDPGGSRSRSGPTGEVAAGGPAPSAPRDPWLPIALGGAGAGAGMAGAALVGRLVGRRFLG